MAEKLVNTEISEYIEVLSSEAPAPGGGAVAALTAAQGAALIVMVANLTIGKKKYAEYEELNIGARDEARTYLEQLMKGVDEDKEAFEQVSKAYSMAKQTDSEKAARREAIAIASVGAADAPLKLMRAGVCALRLAADMIGKSNANLVSDLYVAALNLNAGVQAASYNVAANIPYIADRELAASWGAEAGELAGAAAELAGQILDAGN
ncbi:cyclodeaminase/cyclohydrolase family protein [Mogibacterium timidum]|uniref:Cyclodeaminase/cyclohydrolase family protein n=2 Tax=Mogibacterium timidum TaxID=35519 RepID=A0A7Y9B019_9FIRM|nr:cyclodeaminase/cyclohydrolase family protein [Mogibacterium timidum]NWO22653.1 cyclodeaminase/cyclohydrolase family protein [Mogibacterium timidum]